jgi:NAD(P)-dependent dehydrogenase (short-subunit alcohol dehydrogenase family)
MKKIVITGTNRGIGLQLTRRFVERGDTVWAACRTPSKELQQSGAHVVSGIDVTDANSVAQLVAATEGASIDLLINNAGILLRETLDELDFDNIRQQFEINSLGPLRVSASFSSQMPSGSLVAILTSLMGSMSDNGSGGRYGYRMSKAAVNSAGVSLSHDLRPKGIGVLLLHPGMVATEMTGGRGIPVGESVDGLISLLDNYDADQSGRFFHADGRELPW